MSAQTRSPCPNTHAPDPKAGAFVMPEVGVAGPNAGRRGSRWVKLKAEVRARRESCCRCWQSIDYTLAYPDPACFSVDHYPHPLSTHPHLAEDPANLHAAHLGCNWGAGDRGVAPSVGATSEPW